MRAEQTDQVQLVNDRRGLRAAGIGLAVASGSFFLGLALWFLATNTQRQAGAMGRAPEAMPARVAPAVNPPEDPLKDFVSSILGDTEDVWREQFRSIKQTYTEPRLVLFRGRARSECGNLSSAIGPSYCPLDEKIYLDLGFFQELKDRYHAEADFARAYTIAHEVGHHVLKRLKIGEKALARQHEMSKDAKEQLAVRVELQADFLAGIWAHHADKARQILEPGDVDAALALLAEIGDDRLKLDAQAERDARALTRCWDRKHGTGEQKIHWFKQGLKTGDISQADEIEATR